VIPLWPSYTEDPELETPTEGDQVGVGADEYSAPSEPEYATTSVG